MNEIEKLYGNAGANQICDTFVNWMKCEWKTRQCEDCEHFVYPPFTAEKQLEITKLIGSRYGLKFIVNEAMDYMLSTDLFNDDKFNIQGYGYGFDEAIANLINNLWQDLTEEERKQIKNILE